MTVVCGPMPQAAAALVPWAECWFVALVMLVVVTVAVLFLLSVVAVMGIALGRRGGRR